MFRHKSSSQWVLADPAAWVEAGKKSQASWSTLEGDHRLEGKLRYGKMTSGVFRKLKRQES